MSVSLSDARRWRRRPAERPTEILEAALAAFAEGGLAGTRMEDIAARAGVSKGTLYLYFDGKEDLFREAIRDKVARTLEGLTSATLVGDAPDRVSRFMSTYWGHLRRPHFESMYRLIMGELHQFPELTRFYADEVAGRVLELLARLIQDGIDSGHFRAADPRVAARMIMSLLVQHALWTSRRELFTHLDDRSDEVLLAEIQEFIGRALSVSGAGTGDR